MSRGIALATGLAAVANAQTMQNLCYKVEYNYNLTTMSYMASELLRPVNGFPANHAMVTGGYCGGANAGDPIPHGNDTCTNCKFGSKTTFDTCSDETVCVPHEEDAVIPQDYRECEGEGYVNAGSMFYAYNVPIKLSSNSGYSNAESSDIYFVQDTADEVYMVLSHDIPENADGGRLRLLINSTGLDNTTMIVQMDDPGSSSVHDWVNKPGNATACTADKHKQSEKHDCFAWDNEEGAGTTYWWYNEDHTDGMVLGPLPSTMFSIELDYDIDYGIQDFRLGSYGLTGDGSMAFSTHPVRTAEDTPNMFQVTGYTCDMYCFEAFQETFGTKENVLGPAQNPICGTTIPDVDIDMVLYNEDPAEAQKQYAKELESVVKKALKEFDTDEYCTEACGRAALNVQLACSEVEDEWAVDLVETLTDRLTGQVEECLKEMGDDATSSAAECSPLAAIAGVSLAATVL